MSERAAVMSSRRVAATALALALAGCSSASPTSTTPASSAAGRIVIETRTADGADPAGAHATVTGWLELPERASRVPAVILAHGCYGERADTDEWMSELRRMGYAVLALDSFTGRGVTEICTGRQPVSVLSRVHDAYRALALLAAHPRLDRDRIALMGFSHGGGVVLAASSAGFARLARVDGAPAFAAYLAFYPLGCNVRLLDERRVGGPIRILHGRGRRLDARAALSRPRRAAPHNRPRRHDDRVRGSAPRVRRPRVGHDGPRARRRESRAL